MNVKKVSKLFWILIIVVLIKGVYYAFFIPPWEAPDEPGHVAYVQYLYSSKSLPDNMTRRPINDLSMSHSLMQQSKLLAKIQKGGGTLQRRELYNRNEYRIGVYRGN